MSVFVLEPPMCAARLIYHTVDNIHAQSQSAISVTTIGRVGVYGGDTNALTPPGMNTQTPSPYFCARSKVHSLGVWSVYMMRMGGGSLGGLLWNVFEYSRDAAGHTASNIRQRLYLIGSMLVVCNCTLPF